MSRQILHRRVRTRRKPRKKAATQGDTQRKRKIPFLLDFMTYGFFSFLLGIVIFTSLFTSYFGQYEEPAEISLNNYSITFIFVMSSSLISMIVSFGLTWVLMRKRWKLKKFSNYIKIYVTRAIAAEILNMMAMSFAYLIGLLNFLLTATPDNIWAALLLYIGIKIVIQLVCFFVATYIEVKPVLFGILFIAATFFIFWGALSMGGMT